MVTKPEITRQSLIWLTHVVEALRSHMLLLETILMARCQFVEKSVNSI